MPFAKTTVFECTHSDLSYPNIFRLILLLLVFTILSILLLVFTFVSIILLRLLLHYPMCFQQLLDGLLSSLKA